MKQVTRGFWAAGFFLIAVVMAWPIVAPIMQWIGFIICIGAPLYLVYLVWRRR
jgi:hypothetical protein